MRFKYIIMELVLDFAFISAFLFNVVILFLLTKNSYKGLYKQVLKIVFLLIVLSICSSYASLHKLNFLYFGTFVFDDLITTSIGPLLLLYVKSIFLPSKGLIKENLKNFIIPIVYLFLFSLPYLISTYNKAYLFGYLNDYQNYVSLVIIYSLIYCIIALRVLKKAKKVIKHNYSNLQGVDLTWIRRLLIGAIIIICIDISSTLYELIFGILDWNTLYITSVGVVCLVIYLGYNGVLQSKILIAPFLLQEVNSELIISKNKKTGTTYNYNESELILLQKKLITIMETKKPFLDEDLSLKSLAELLGISDKKLSAVLNQYLKISFYDYVNGFKVKDVMHKMEDPYYERYTLLAIAFESGFNSKTSFNRIFKKAANCSPSEYKKRLKSGE